MVLHHHIVVICYSSMRTPGAFLVSVGSPTGRLVSSVTVSSLAIIIHALPPQPHLMMHHHILECRSQAVLYGRASASKRLPLWFILYPPSSSNHSFPWEVFAWPRRLGCQPTNHISTSCSWLSLPPPPPSSKLDWCWFTMRDAVVYSMVSHNQTNRWQRWGNRRPSIDRSVMDVLPFFMAAMCITTCIGRWTSSQPTILSPPPLYQKHAAGGGGRGGMFSVVALC